MNQQEIDERIARAKANGTFRVAQIPGQPKDTDGIIVENGSTPVPPPAPAAHGLGRGSSDATIYFDNSKEAELAERSRSRQVVNTNGRAQEIVMPETSTEPTDLNSVKVGSLLVFHSDDGGYFETSREKVVVILADGTRLTDRRAAWALFTELKKLADAEKAALRKAGKR